MSRPLVILYGSQTGTAGDVAERIGREARRRHFDTRVQGLDEYNVARLVDEKYVVFVVATCGQGNEPDNMRAFWRFLLRKGLPSNALSGLRTAVFGLGDSSYANYNVVGKRLFRRLEQIGASFLVPRGDGDDQHALGIDATLDPWIQNLFDALLVHSPLPQGVDIKPAKELPPPKYIIEPVGAHGDVSETTAPSVAVADGSYSRHAPYHARIVANERLTDQVHFQDVRHIEFDIEGSKIVYEPGDVAVIQPRNSISDLDPVLERLGLVKARNIVVSITPSPVHQQPLPPNWPSRMTIEELVSRIDVFGKPRRYFFEQLALLATAPHEKEKLEEYCTALGQDDLFVYCYRPRRTSFEVLCDFPSVCVPLVRLIDLFPPIAPRSFSIASSQTVHPTRLHLCVAIVKYKTKLMMTPRWGVCSKWLAQVEPQQTTAALWISKGTMRLPSDPTVPIVAIGPGTGSAPFRSFMQERLNQQATLSVAFLGFRSSTGDFLYGNEWTKLAADGRFKVYTAFSRDQEAKVYVQHRIVQAGAVVWNAMERGGHIYVCGNAKRMPDDVKAALAQIATTYGGYEDGVAFIDRLARSGRFLVETW